MRTVRAPAGDAAGLDSIFVAGGIHAAALGVSGGAMPAAELVRKLAAEEGLGGELPTFCAGAFRWGGGGGGG